MKYNFDKNVDRKNSNCIKWDLCTKSYSDYDLIPLWVADMDFEVVPEIVEALEKRIKHGVFGYSHTPDSYYEAAIGWFEKRFNWEVEREWIKLTPGVVPGINSLIAAFTKPGDEVILQTPVYHPFYTLVKNNGCQVIENPLIFKDEKYEMNFQNLEKVITKKTRLLILCSPHNPVGRVWTKEELTKLGEICIKHNILVISDEIHADIVYKPHEHTVFSAINEDFSQNSIICTAPNKTFNIAGLETANMIIKNEKLRREFEIQLDKHCVQGLNLLGVVAQEAAYTHGEQWYQELMEYLSDNLEFTLNFFKERIPKIKAIRPEGTYLLWLDCSALDLNSEELNNFFMNKCKVWLNDGAMFGTKGQLFQRMNLGTRRELIKEALERIEREVNKI